MHQPIDPELTARAEAVALRRQLRAALASGLALPEQHAATNATLQTLAHAAIVRPLDFATPEAVSVQTLQRWWRSVALPHSRPAT